MVSNTENKAASVKKKAVVSSFLKKYGIFLIFILMVGILSILSPAFLKAGNILNIIRQISVIGLIALGVTFVIISAGIDLSSGSVLALAAVFAASFAQKPDWVAVIHPSLTNLPVVFPLAVGLLIGTACGFANGIIIAKTKIPPFIATLGMMVAARGMALLYSNGRPISGLSDSYNYVGQGVLLGIPFPILILITMAVVSHIMLKHTRLGKYTFAIGGNELAAKVSGINIDRYKTIIYTYAGFLAGMAGIMISSRIGSGQPGLGVSYELDAIAAAVIGGTSLTGGVGSIPGTLIGAMILGVLNNGLDLLNVSAYWQQIIKGTIIVVAVIIDVRKHRMK